MQKNNEVRQLLKDKNITTENVTVDQLSDLRDILDKKLKESGIYNGTARLSRIKHLKFMTMDTEQWDGREAISFNRDGFIGFAGWADSKNIKPILEATIEWANNIQQTD